MADTTAELALELEAWRRGRDDHARPLAYGGTTGPRDVAHAVESAVRGTLPPYDDARPISLPPRSTEG